MAWMQSISNGLSNTAHEVANLMWNTTLTPNEIEERNNIKATLVLVKIATLVATAVSFVLFITAPSLFTGGLLALVGYTGFEVYTVSTNAKEIFDKALVEIWARRNQGALLSQLTKGAPVARALVL